MDVVSLQLVGLQLIDIKRSAEAALAKAAAIGRSLDAKAASAKPNQSAILGLENWASGVSYADAT